MQSVLDKTRGNNFQSTGIEGALRSIRHQLDTAQEVDLLDTDRLHQSKSITVGEINSGNLHEVNNLFSQAFPSSHQYQAMIEDSMTKIADGHTRYESTFNKGIFIDAKYLVLKADDKIVGVCGCFSKLQRAEGSDELVPVKPGEFWLGWTAVSPDVQGQGLGGMLLTLVEEEARSRGATHMKLSTGSTPFYTQSRGFYEKAGYQVVETESKPLTPGITGLIHEGKGTIGGVIYQKSL